MTQPHTRPLTTLFCATLVCVATAACTRPAAEERQGAARNRPVKSRQPVRAIPPPPPPTSSVQFKLVGKFSDQPSWDVNLINAPASAHDNKPARLKVSAELLHELNDKNFHRLDKVLLLSKLWKARVFEAPAGVKPLTGEGGDRHFLVTMRVGPDNGLGGHASGLTYEIVLQSRHRSAKIKGLHRDTIKARTAKAALDELEQGFKAGLTHAMVSFRQRLRQQLKTQKKVRPRPPQ